MYTIKAILYTYENGQLVANEQTVFSSSTQDTRPVSEAKGSFELSEGGSITFSLAYGHPLFDKLEPLETFIRVIDDETSEEIFFGRVFQKSDPTFTGLISYNAEGCLSFLHDGECALEKKDGKAKEIKFTKTAAEFFQWCIGQYNNSVSDERRRFWLGNVTVDKKTDSKEYVINDYTEIRSLLDQKLKNVYGGYFRARKRASGGHYLDWIKEYDTLNPQAIDIGVNVSSLTNTKSGEGIYTVLRPVGANGILLDEETIDIFSAANMAKIGRIVKTVNFSEAKTKEKLREAADTYLSKYETAMLCETDIHLIDLHYLDGSQPKIRLGDRFDNIRGTGGVEFTVAHMDIDFLHPENDTFNFKNRKDLESNLMNGLSGGTISRSTSRGARSAGLGLKWYKETSDTAQILAEKISLNGKEIELHGVTIKETADNFDRLSRTLEVEGGIETKDWPEWKPGIYYYKDEKVSRVVNNKVTGYICLETHVAETEWNDTEAAYWKEYESLDKSVTRLWGTEVIQDSTKIAEVAGMYQVVTDYYDDWPSWIANGHQYKVGNRVKVFKVDKYYGYVCKKDHMSSEHFDSDSENWIEQHGNKSIQLLDGASFILDDLNGSQTTVATAIDGLNKFAGSALWTQRDAIIGVVGEFDVVTDPVTGIKTLRIKSGGGMKILRDGVEYGLYDDGSLTGGVIAGKINLSDWPVWKKQTAYSVGAQVRVDGKGYVCKTAHTSLNSFSDDEKVYWNEYTGNRINFEQLNADVSDYTAMGLFSEGNLDGGMLVQKINSNTWPEWVSGTTYKVGDKVRKDGKAYVCKTANSDTSFVKAKWNEYTSTKILGDVVDITASQLVQIGVVTGDTLTAGLIAERINTSDWPEWVSGTLYEVGAHVRHNGKGYTCINRNQNTSWVSSNWEEYADTKIDFNQLNTNVTDYTAMGLFNEDTLEAGLLVQKLNDGSTESQILGTRILAGDSYSTGYISNDHKHFYKNRAMTNEYDTVAGKLYGDIPSEKVYYWNGTQYVETSKSLGMKLSDMEGFIAGKATIGELNAMRANIVELLAEYIKADKLTTSIANAGLITVDSLQFKNGTTPTGSTNYTNLRQTVEAYKIVETSAGSGEYKLQYKTYQGGWVDAPDSATFSRATSGGSVTLSGNWSGTTYSVTATAGTIEGTPPSTKVYLTVDKQNPNGDASGTIYARIYKDSTSSSSNILNTKEMTLVEDVSAKKVYLKTENAVLTKGVISTSDTYDAGLSKGWKNAYAKVAIPGSSTSATSVTFKTPNEESNSNPVQNSHVLSFGNNGNNSVYLYQATDGGQGITIAKFDHNKYDAGLSQGWKNAYAKVAIPGSSTSATSVTFKTPNEESNSNPVQNSHVLSFGNNGNNSVYLYQATDGGQGITIAKFDHNKYDAGLSKGWKNAYAKVAIPGSSTSATSVTFKTPNEESNSNPVQNSHVLSFGNNGNNSVYLYQATDGGQGITIAKFDHNKYDAGLSQGWKNAYAKVAIPGSSTSATSVTFKTPNEESNSNPVQNSHVLSFGNNGNNSVYLYQATDGGQGITIAKFDHNKYNAGWDYALDNKISRTAQAATDQETTIKTLDYGQRWTISDTRIKSDNSTTIVKYTVAAPADNWATGFDDGKPTGTTLGSIVTGTTYNVSVARGKYAAVGTTINLADAYAAARVGYYTSTEYTNYGTACYREGSSDVGWSTKWSTEPSATYSGGDNNTLTVATIGRVNSKGVSSNHSGSWKIYVTSDDNVAYARLASTTGNIIAKVQHNKYTTGYRAGSYAVDRTAVWSNGSPYTDGPENTFRVTSTGRVNSSGAEANFVSSAKIVLTSDNNNAYARLNGTGGTIVAKLYHGKYTTGYSKGQSDVELKTGSWSSGSRTIKVMGQNDTVLQQANISIPDVTDLTLSENSGYSYTTTSSGKTYTNGADGYDLITSGANGDAAIVVKSTWTCGGKSFDINKLVHTPATLLYRKGFSDGAASVTPSHNITITTNASWYTSGSATEANAKSAAATAMGCSTSKLTSITSGRFKNSSWVWFKVTCGGTAKYYYTKIT